ncbi:MAG: phosphoenolpyruvate carboxylase [Caldilineaceae bacterium]|nr:phosphoenolpyruvate carboxylase [Caldilineaceae bacterium]
MITDQQDRLRTSIRLLGNLLGETIIEQEGLAIFELEETLRALTKAWRGGDQQAQAAIEQMLPPMLDDLPRGLAMLKAFTTFFQLTNLAEEQERVNVLRDRARLAQEHRTPVRETIADAIRRLRDLDVSASEMRLLLDDLLIMPVFTAHPTESKRLAILRRLREIANLLHSFERHDLLPNEEVQLTERLRENMTVLWQSDETRDRRPTVMDEVRTGAYYFENTIFHLVPRIYEELARALEEYYPGEYFILPHFLRYGSWIGGDRDGNPFVTPDVTEEAIREHKETVLTFYNVEVDKLYHHLSPAVTRVGFSQALLDSIEEDRKLAPVSELEQLEWFRIEPYRQKLIMMFRRLRATRAENRIPWRTRVDDPRAYRNASEFLHDLYLIRDSLNANNGERLAQSDLARLIRAAEVFGFHMVTLDIRQHAERHRAALAEIMEGYGLASDYTGMDEKARVALLSREIESRRPLTARLNFSDETNQTVELFRLIRRAHEQVDEQAIQTYIISMTTQVSNVLEVLLLANDAGLLGKLDVAPLFETIEDLKNAPQIMTEIFANRVYQQHLEQRGNHQQIMIGYSDSNKDGGYLRANWMLYDAQRNLARVCAAHGIQLTLFHGRGGSLGRGGGRTNRAILAQPPESVRGRFKITEQGEVISSRYDDREIAHRHLEQMVNAVLLSSTRRSTPAQEQAWSAVMDEVSSRAYRHYRALVEKSEFLQYFHDTTPIDLIDRLNIGSRPARRKKTAQINDLRAIPWVFSWTQSRVNLPSWFGVGAALASWLEDDPGETRLPQLRQMYREWPFFTTILDNVQVGLSIGDIAIAALYAGLTTDAVRRAVFSELEAEFERTKQMVLAITGYGELLENEQWLRQSIRRRNPYVDPLSYLQVALLRRLRAREADGVSNEETEQLQRALLLSANGIAAGLQNTG